MRFIKMSQLSCLLVALTLLVTACGKDRTGEPTVEEVRIGVLLPFTGSWSWIGPAVNGVRLAADEINASGGIRTKDGRLHKVKLYIEDSGTESRTAISGARKLYDVNKVIAIIGPTSATVRSVIPVTKDAGAVQVSPTAGTTALDTRGGGIDDEWIFRTVSSDVVMGSGMAWYAKNELGAKRAACFFTDDEGARSIYGVIKDACSFLGLEIVGEVFFPSGQPSYRSELTRAIQDDPDVIFFESGPETGGIFFKQWYELELGGQWIGTDFVNEPFVHATWPASEKVIGVNPGPLPGPRFEQWLSAYENSTGRSGLDPFAINAYDAMNIIALALERSGEISSEAIRKSIREVAGAPGEEVEDFAKGLELLRQGKEVDYSGMAGPQDFNEFGDPVTYLKVERVEEERLVRIGTLTDESIGDVIGEVLKIRKGRKAVE